MTDKPHVLIVEARFYSAIADEMKNAAIAELEKDDCTYEVVAVAGAFELPAAIKFASQRNDGRQFDGYVALGCVIRGETSHYDYVCVESARKLQDLAVDSNMAIGYGVLTVENEAQAWARARASEKNKGGAVTRACLDMIALKRQYGVA
ncbi:6,7-dimethyl-8-ribityllumazine synthase [Kiloniella majae]|uniref:6,7-dimethyl-8-ribityllumazine synthase n=1 Tax=Kiloniella majae TaxID=1938558 RepID=UPI000A2777E2|nr:6,7-dimethyl-8-ribityllumazine synthase [Kiloniella majae]